MSAIEEWSTTAGGNNDPSPDGFPEGMLQNGYNNSAREVMAAVRTWYETADWVNVVSGYTVTRLDASRVEIASYPVAINFPVGCRVLLMSSVICNVTAVVVNGGNLEITVDGAVPNPCTRIDRFLAVTVRTGAFTAVGNSVGQLALHTAAGPLLEAAYFNVGTAAGELPRNADLGSASVLATGTAIGQVPVHSSTGPLKKGAYSDFARSYTAKTAASAGLDGAIQVIPDLSNIAVPGAPDGVKQYRVNAHVEISADDTTDGDFTVTVKVGAAGTVADASVFSTTRYSQGNDGDQRHWGIEVCGLQITPASGDRVSLCFTSPANNDFTVHGTAPRISFLEIVEIPPA